ncbi:unnamed protein product, partial [Laminaria digitata]
EGGRIEVESRRREDGGVELIVSDNGVGMDEKDFATVLTPFGQVENALSRNYTGTGLGLSLVKSMIELHGGTVAIESALGEGASVKLLFPSVRVQGSDANGQAAE